MPAVAAPTPASVAGMAPETPEVPEVPIPPVTPITPQGPEPTPLPKKPSRLKPFIVPAIIALVAATAAAGGVYFWMASQNKTLKTQTANDRITIAGLQSEVATKTKELAAAKAAATPPTDSEQITTEVKRNCEAEVDHTYVANGDANISGDFAVIIYGCKAKTAKTPVSYTATLKKVDGGWIIIAKGATKPSSTTQKTYGIPSSLYQ